MGSGYSVTETKSEDGISGSFVIIRKENNNNVENDPEEAETYSEEEQEESLERRVSKLELEVSKIGLLLCQEPPINSTQKTGSPLTIKTTHPSGSEYCNSNIGGVSSRPNNDNIGTCTFSIHVFPSNPEAEPGIPNPGFYAIMNKAICLGELKRRAQDPYDLLPWCSGTMGIVPMIHLTDGIRRIRNKVEPMDYI